MYTDRILALIKAAKRIPGTHNVAGYICCRGCGIRLEDNRDHHEDCWVAELIKAIKDLEA
jgi:hypothetical protein